MESAAMFGVSLGYRGSVSHCHYLAPDANTAKSRLEDIQDPR